MKSYESLEGLAARRRAAGFTQDSLAGVLGIQRANIAMYETGRAWPPAALLPAMAEVLGCTIEQLYEAERKEEDDGIPFN